MKKKFRFTIEIAADIPEQITPALIERIVSEIDKEKRLSNYQPQTEKLQAFIDFIKNNENIHEACLTGDLFFNLSENGVDEELIEFLNPKCFDDIALENSARLDDETRLLINRLYQNADSYDKDDSIDEEGNPIPNSKKNILDALKREIDTEIIQQSVLNYKITAASLKMENGE